MADEQEFHMERVMHRIDSFMETLNLSKLSQAGD
jgi:hypothetical protein